MSTSPIDCQVITQRASHPTERYLALISHAAVARHFDFV